MVGPPVGACVLPKQPVLVEMLEVAAADVQGQLKTCPLSIPLGLQNFPHRVNLKGLVDPPVPLSTMSPVRPGNMVSPDNIPTIGKPDRKESAHQECALPTYCGVLSPLKSHDPTRMGEHTPVRSCRSQLPSQFPPRYDYHGPLGGWLVENLFIVNPDR